MLNFGNGAAPGFLRPRFFPERPRRRENGLRESNDPAGCTCKIFAAHRWVEPDSTLFTPNDCFQTSTSRFVAPDCCRSRARFFSFMSFSLDGINCLNLLLRRFEIDPYSERVKPLRIGIVGFDQVDALDLVGPAEAFASARPMTRGATGQRLRSRDPRPNELTIRRRVRIVFQPRTTLRAAPRLDTIIIPGALDCGALRPIGRSRAGSKIVGKVRRIVSICTGIYALAASGLLDGRRVTTHWRFAADVTRRFPNLRVEPNALLFETAISTPRPG